MAKVHSGHTGSIVTINIKHQMFFEITPIMLIPDFISLYIFFKVIATKFNNLLDKLEMWFWILQIIVSFFFFKPFYQLTVEVRSPNKIINIFEILFRWVCLNIIETVTKLKCWRRFNRFVCLFLEKQNGLLSNQSSVFYFYNIKLWFSFSLLSL